MKRKNIMIAISLILTTLSPVKAHAFNCGCGLLDNACMEQCIRSHVPPQYGPSIDGNVDDLFGTPGLKPLNEVHDDWCRADPDYYGC